MVTLFGSLLFIVPAGMLVRYYCNMPDQPFKINAMQVMCINDNFFNSDGLPDKHPCAGSVYLVTGIFEKYDLVFYDLAGFPGTAWDTRDFAFISDLDEKILYNSQIKKQ